MAIGMPSIKQSGKEKKFMIDPGAAISVAPYASFKNVKLDKCGGGKI